MTKRVGVRFRKNERRLFTSQGSSGGSPWKVLTQDYRKWKKKVRPGKKIMVFDGGLRRSLTRATEPSYVQFSIFSKRGDSKIVVGTKDVKAAWHGPKSGNPLANPNLPVRDVLAHTGKQIREYGLKDVWPVMEAKFERATRAISAGAGRR